MYHSTDGTGKQKTHLFSVLLRIGTGDGPKYSTPVFKKKSCLQDNLFQTNNCTQVIQGFAEAPNVQASIEKLDNRVT